MAAEVDPNEGEPGERGTPLLSIELRGPRGKRKAHSEPELAVTSTIGKE